MPRSSSSIEKPTPSTAHDIGKHPPGLAAAALVAGSILVGCSRRIVVSERQSLSRSQGAGETGALVCSVPQTLVTVDGSSGKASVVTETIAPPIKPDASARCRLRFTSGGMTVDKPNPGLDGSGLLTAGTATTTDQTPAVTVTLTGSGASISSAVVGNVPDQQHAQSSTHKRGDTHATD